jgi:hypothetical protein
MPIEANNRSVAMRKDLIRIAVGAAVAVGTLASPTVADARWGHHGFPVGPVLGGLAAGALVGAALAAPPVYFAPECYVRHERFWDGWGWRFRRVQECY